MYAIRSYYGVDLRADSVTLLIARLALDKTRRDLSVLLNRNESETFEVDASVPAAGEYELEGLLETAQEQNTTYRIYLGDRNNFV